jgi:hypothetical protein
MRPDGDQMGTGNPQMFYIVGNKMEGYPQYDADNWQGVVPNYAAVEQIRSDVPFFPSYVEAEPVEQAYTDVLENVGATRPQRDAIDRRIIREVRERTFTYRGSKDNLPGIIDSQEDVGGYPILKGGPVPEDSDHDGLPDWRELQMGLNPNSPAGDYSDTNGDPDGDGFTHMDDYLEYLAEGGFQFPGYNCTKGIPADLDGDCRVHFSDLTELGRLWLTRAALADLNGDGQVNLGDLVELAEDWLTCNREPAAACFAE